MFFVPKHLNFSLQFLGSKKSFWPPTQYLSLELIICFVKFRGILIRVIELGFSRLLQSPGPLPQWGLHQVLNAGSPYTRLSGAAPGVLRVPWAFATEDLCRETSHTLHTHKAILLPWGPALNLFPAQFGGPG